MDVKDASMNECSYPLVYYIINDFESELLQLGLEENDYLCVELSVMIPEDRSSDGYASASAAVEAIHIEDNSDPFPLPPNYVKVILFQGAVSFSALSSVYHQKGIASANQAKIGWGNIYPNESNTHNRTEYIQMRGPFGGQCQGIDHMTKLPFKNWTHRPGLCKMRQF
jgi:hypothetical protein